jgi:hypothetical protein
VSYLDLHQSLQKEHQLKKSIFIGYLSGFLIFTNMCFAQNSSTETTKASTTEVSLEQKTIYSLGLSLNIYDKTLQEALKINDDTMAKTKEVFKKYNLKALRQDRYSAGMSSNSQYQASQENLQFYSFTNFSFEKSNINLNDLVIELYSLGWSSINYEEYSQY